MGHNLQGLGSATLDVMGGLVTEARPEDLPEGASPRTWDTDFLVGSVFTRPGLASIYSFTNCLTITAVSINCDSSLAIGAIPPKVDTGNTGPEAPSTTVDMLDWVMIGYPQRTTSHLTGSGNPSYNWKDADGQKVWLIKNSAGHPWDIYVYNATAIMHWITENGDQGQFSNALAYKQFLQPVPVIPRFFDTAGSAVTIDTPGPNQFVRTVNCGADAQPLISLGDVRGVTNTPVTMSFTGLGTFPVIEVDYYYGGTPSTGFNQREQFFYANTLGLVQWTHATLVAGAYQIDQTTTKSGISSGGCPVPSFPCYPIPNWIGGVPGTGVNAQ